MGVHPEKKGESPKSAGAPNVHLTRNTILEAVQPEPFDQRHYTIVVGFIDEIKADIVRVYPQLDLRTYFQIPRTAIVFAEPVIADQESSPTKLVVDASAKVGVVKVFTGTVEARFLSGPLAASNLGSARPDVSAGTQSQSEVPGSLDPCCLLTQVWGNIGPSNCPVHCALKITDPISALLPGPLAP